LDDDDPELLQPGDKVLDQVVPPLANAKAVAPHWSVPILPAALKPISHEGTKA